MTQAKIFEEGNYEFNFSPVGDWKLVFNDNCCEKRENHLYINGNLISSYYGEDDEKHIIDYVKSIMTLKRAVRVIWEYRCWSEEEDGASSYEWVDWKDGLHKFENGDCTVFLQISGEKYASGDSEEEALHCLINCPYTLDGFVVEI